MSRGHLVLLPKPAVLETAEGRFTLDGTTPLAAVPAFDRAAAWLRGALGPATGCRLEAGPGGIEIVQAEGLPAEGYRLTVRPGLVRIEAADPAGAFYGAQTLRQLLPPSVFRAGRVGDGPWTIPAVTVEDAPRFGWRGCMIDVSRHFLPKPDLLRYVDLLAAHKLNVLHLHLTDDPGWRLEIKRYPKLTEVGGWRRETSVGWRGLGRFNGRPYGGFYTQDDIREIVAYAADRFVTVVPEIELPGHSRAAIAAYPELGHGDQPLEVATSWHITQNVLNVEDDTIAFYKGIFEEVLDLFPSAHIHIGGDEARKEEWRESPVAQRRIRDLGLGDEYGLQSWFIRQFADFLTARGRKLYGWDEILEGGAPPGAVIASWRGNYGAVAAARAGHDVVACPNTEVYLDYRQSERADEPTPVGSVVSLRDVYDFEPVPAELAGTPDAARVIGGQANLWTEYMDSPRVLDYMAFPRVSALAEALWSGPERDYDDFLVRLAEHERRLDALGVEYRRQDGPRPWQTRPDAPGNPRDRADVEAGIAEITRNIRG
ncbi:beta-N-acetylhexosaminidase [Streptosporangium sp. KLBMP 9127]|nr:beta-N-acetylhexosaminidase [Streptosporangium sp. KLBMP 9127]